MSEKESKKASDEGLIKDRYELIIGELQTVFTFGYVLLILLGMILEFGYYHGFGINIFEYTVVGDFLLAPFRRPISLAILTFIGIYILITYPLDKWLAKKYPRMYRILNFGLVRADKSTRYRNLMFAATGVFLIFFFAINIGHSAKNTMFKMPNNVKIHFSTKQHPLQGIKFGQTNTYLFLIDTSKQVKVVPMASNVLWIEEL